MARNPLPGLVLDRACPGRDLVLNLRLAPSGHPHEEPADAERVLGVDRHAPFEVVAEIEAVRPERPPSDGPDRIALTLAFAHTPVEEAVIELLEHELEVLGRIRRGLAIEPGVPVLVHPFEVHRIA